MTVKKNGFTNGNKNKQAERKFSLSMSFIGASMKRRDLD